MTDRSTLNGRDDLLELAERYETVTALDLTPETAEGRRARPGSRLPPGMQEVLDADEVAAALKTVDEWAEFICHILADECDATVPDPTPARLRLGAEHAAHLLNHDDQALAFALSDDLREHLRTVRKLSNRGIRRVRTGMRCQSVSCPGQLVSPLGGPDRTDDALVCEKCGARVPHVVWSAWPKARVTYVTVEHAAKLAGTTVPAIKMRAARNKWRRIGTGRDVRYHVDDVRAEYGASA